MFGNLYDCPLFSEYFSEEIISKRINILIHFQVAVDTFFFGFCLNICAHFNIIRSLTFENNLNYKGFIKYHQEVLELCSCLNDIYFPVIFTQFLVSSVLLCVIGFQLVMVSFNKILLKTFIQNDNTTQFQAPDFFKILLLLAFSCAILIQLFIYAYGGTLIMEEVLKLKTFKFILDNFFV